MDLYRIKPFCCQSFGLDKELITVLCDQCTFVATRLARTIMESCRSFRTMAEHAEHVSKALRGHNCEQGIGELLRQGMFISEQSFTDQLPTLGDNRAKITTLGVITANRVESCGYALTSIRDNVNCFGRKAMFVVVDDSLDSDTRCLYKQQLHYAATRFSQPILYAGRDEKEQYVTELSRAGIDPDVAAFALLGNACGLPTIGANRNCLLLDTVGEFILSVDDDIVCQTSRHAATIPQLQIHSHGYPRDILFFNDRAELLREVEWETIDVLEAHEDMLGRSIGNLLRSSRGARGIVFEDTCDHIIVGALTGSARVTATIGGVAGHLQLHSPQWMLTGTGQLRKRLLSSRSIYDLAFTSREVQTVAQGPTISHSPFFMAGHIGIDNQHMVPPFLPISRAEDTVFGMLTMKCFDQCYFGHVPVAMLHTAVERRCIPQQEFRIADLIAALISSYCAPAHMSPSAVLQALGKHLEGIAALAPQDFCFCVSELVRVWQAQLIQQWQRGLAALAEYPDHWQRDIRHWHEEVVRFRLCLRPFYSK